MDQPTVCGVSEPVEGNLAADETERGVLERVRRLVESCRDQCLWFLSPGYLPSDREKAIRHLRYIDRYGDRRTYIRAREFQRELRRLIATRRRRVVVSKDLRLPQRRAVVNWSTS